MNSKNVAADWSYEETVEQVEDILQQIERGDLELTEVLEQFAIGVASLQQCEDFLATQQEQVELLLETLGD
jgi:exodeoxyribonuclease VII small subunit